MSEPILQRRAPHLSHVATRAEPAPVGVVEDHRVDTGIVAPFEQGGRDGFAHPLRQRVQRRGTIERDMADSTVRADNDVGHVS